MSFTTFFIYLLVLYWVFYVLDKKYKFVVRFQNKNNKVFRRIINLISIASFIALILLSNYEEYFNSLGIHEAYLQGILGFPLVLRYYINIKISEMITVRKQQFKNRDVEVTFCYYCGSELNGSNSCPSCGKELEL